MKTDGSDKDTKGKSLEHSPVQGLKELLNSDYVKNRFLEVMGEKASAFLASVLNAIQKNPELAKCDQGSLLSSAMVAATLDLPIDSNLGFAAIVPYNTKMFDKATKKEYWVTLAQFQIMYKGYIQLALRSGQYKTINVSPIYEDEFESYDIITGDIVIHPVKGGFREQENFEKIIGYAAFFRLINGFERIEYWPLSRIIAHGKRFSKSFDKPNGLWKKDPHAMYAKTVLKNTLSKWGILSVTMQSAIVADQAVLKDFSKPIESDNVNYIDNTIENTAFPMEGVAAADTPTEAEQETSATVPAETDNSDKEPETPEAKPSTAAAPQAAAGAGVSPTKPGKSGNSSLFSPQEEKDMEQHQQEQRGSAPNFNK